MNTSLIIEPTNTAQTAIIWMHGLGADAHDFEGIVPFLPTEKHHTRMIFPNAQKRAVTINGGMVMPAWYDIIDLELRNADTQGITESQQMIQAIIDEQIDAGINSENIILAGFSQGGAMALHTGLRCPSKLAGILALSCYLLERKNHATERHQANQDTAIWMANGTLDPVVSYELGKSSGEFLSQAGHDVEFVSYQMEHQVSTAEINDLAKWIDARFS